MTDTHWSPAEHISTARVRAALENAMSVHVGGTGRIATFHRRESAYATSCAIEELDVTLEDGTALSLMLKHLGQTAAHGTRVTPMFVHDPLREWRLYHTTFPVLALGTAQCYGGMIDQVGREYSIFLERVPGGPLWQVGEFDVWKIAARWLATLHSRYEGNTEMVAAEAPLLRYDAAFYQIWIDRAREFQRGRAGGRGPEDLSCLAERYPRAVERLCALPSTFIHGEFYPSNVLVHQTAGGCRICPIDWEMAAVGPGLIDLAALVSGSWTGEQRGALAGAYYDALAPTSHWRSGRGDFMEALDCCRLHLAIRWLGWAPDWSPPPEHRYDWLAEALQLAESLEL